MKDGKTTTCDACGKRIPDVGTQGAIVGALNGIVADRGYCFVFDYCPDSVECFVKAVTKRVAECGELLKSK